MNYISIGCFTSSKLLQLLNIKLLMSLVGLFDGVCFVFLFFWTGQKAFTLTVIIILGLGFTAGTFESGIPSKKCHTVVLYSYYRCDFSNLRADIPEVDRSCFFPLECSLQHRIHDDFRVEQLSHI